MLVFEMRPASLIMVLVGFAALSGCSRNASVVRSTVLIAAATQGDLQTSAGSLKDVIYVQRPFLCVPNTDSVLFRVDPDERGATPVTVHFGQVADKYVEVQRGLKPGDRVILSDMSAYQGSDRIDLK
jgi:hypothetical protein